MEAVDVADHGPTDEQDRRSVHENRVRPVPDRRPPGRLGVPNVGARPGEAGTAHGELELQGPAHAVRPAARPPLVRGRHLRDRFAVAGREEVQAEVTLGVGAQQPGRARRRQGARGMAVLHSSRYMAEEVGRDEEGVQDPAAAVEADERELVG